MKKLLTVFVCACAGLAHAEFKDGNKLLSEITDGGYYNQGVAMGYIMGVSDASVRITHCPPPNSTAGQMFDAVKMYLNNNPQNRHYSADSIVNHVLGGIWPCKKGSGV